MADPWGPYYGTTYDKVVQAVKNYYGSSTDIYEKVLRGPSQVEYTAEDLATISKTPGVSVTVTKDGRFAGWDYEYPFADIDDPVTNNSNAVTSQYGKSGSFNGRVNGSYTWEGEPPTQKRLFTSGARSVSTGAKVATVASKVSTAITAVAIGAQLGAKIDSALYNVGKFFDLNPPEELNPQTWDSIATSEGGKDLIRHLFDIDDNGNTTMYAPKDAIDYMYRYWVEQGMFDSGIEAEYDDPMVEGVPQPIPLVSGQTIVVHDNGNSRQYRNAEYLLISTNGRQYRTTAISRQTVAPIESSGDGGTTWSTSYTRNETTLNGTPFQINTYDASSSPFTNISPGNIYYYGNPTDTKVLTTIIDGSITQSIPGIEPEPNQTLIDPSQVPSGGSVVDAYPNIFKNPIQENVPQPDGTTKTIVYYPVPFPKVTDTDKPTTGGNNQSDPKITPESPDDQKEPMTDIITNPYPQPETPTPGPPATPPDTGTGSTPPVTVPTGEASAMWTIYNPTQAQLDAFGGWLWSSNFVDQLKKLFNDPMQAIIGVHKVFATPSTGSQVNIVCGYIDSGCPAAEVTNQYTTIDCGTVNLREYYGNVFDYAPYTKISLYLPFIGIVDLDVADVMRGSVNVKYHVDVITGACLADVKINRDGESAILYQYAGSAIVTYPVSSGSYASAVNGVLSLAAGVAGTVMTGGAAAPALIGGAVGLSHIHANVQHSGGFSGAPGAMGGKKPYLIISRAQDNNASDFEHYEGKPANKTVKLGNCDGFVKVKSINIDAVPATYGELDQIVSLLKTGVII